jgi:hypothetical protein
MHSKAQTAVDKVEAERLVNLGQVLCASVSRARSSSGADGYSAQARLVPTQPGRVISALAIREGYRRKHVESKFVGTVLSI